MTKKFWQFKKDLWNLEHENKVKYVQIWEDLPKRPTKISKLLNLYSKSKLFTKPVNISYAVIMGLLNIGN